jgi:hypothetical protein
LVRAIAVRPSTPIRSDLVVAGIGVLPFRALAGVIEDRLAVHLQVDVAVDALDRAQQDMRGVVIGRRSTVGLAALIGVVPGRHDQRVPHDEPAGWGLPGRLQHQGAGQVPPGGRHRDAEWTDPERAARAIQQRGEDARRIGTRHTHPLDGAGRRDQAIRLAVGEERVFTDAREIAGTVVRVLRWRRAGR